MSELGLVLFKFLVTSSVVLALSFVAEHVSPRWAGLLSGFPTGSAIILYFYALEHGVRFAGDSALYNMVGMVAMQVFLYCYYLAGAWSRPGKIPMAILCGLVGYFAAVWLLNFLPVSPHLSLVAGLLSIVLFRMLFIGIHHAQITGKIKPTFRVILMRALVSALIVCLITAVAKLVGRSWAGLFSAFPTTVFPLILIIHFSYGEKYAHAIIKHVPEGLGGLLCYSLIIALSYPRLHLYTGMGLGFSGAILYLLMHHCISRRLQSKIT